MTNLESARPGSVRVALLTCGGLLRGRVAAPFQSDASK